MEGRELAEFKNKVLELMALQGSSSMGIHFIYEKMSHPFTNPYDLMEILVAMTEEAPKYFDFDEDQPPNWFSTNDMTVIFLNKGGFVNQYDSEIEADIEALTLAKQEQGIKDLQERNLILSNQLAEMKLRTHIWPLVISGISTIVAVVSLVYTFNTSSDIVSKEELKEIKDSIEGVRKENTELKERVWKAELLIAVYEDNKEKDKKQ